MKINCVIKNTKILQQLETLVESISNRLISKDILPTPTNIFDQARNLGVEVDLSTIGAIYAKNLSGTDATFMTIAEVAKETGADLNNTIKKMIQLNKGVKEIGKRSPAEAVASAIANIFIDRNTPLQSKTLMRNMQDIVLKGLKRHIAGNPVSNSSNPFDVAREALSNMDTLGITDIHGHLNNLRAVFADVKIELDKQIAELQRQNASPATIQKYEDMIETVQNSVYQLFLSKTEARDIINEAIKQFKNGIFTKTDKKGNVKPDYDALSGHVKSEQDLRENVRAALTDAGFDVRDIRIIENSLAQEFKDAYANILEKARNKLNAKQEAKDRPVITKSDMERLAQLHALGAFGSVHEKQIYELLGLSESSMKDLNEVESIAEELNRMRDAGFIEGNEKERELNQMINDIIDKARFADAPTNYKTAKVISNLVSMANLSLLNNIKNRAENWAGGEIEKFSQFVKRGFEFAPKEITALSKAQKNNIVFNGGQSAGEMDMLFHGNTEISNKVRKKILGWVSDGSNESKERAVNWVYNQVMGTAALNGIDTLNKIQNTWTRFISNMEVVLVDNGSAKNIKEAREKLHEQMFGNVTDKNGNTVTRWEDAENKARELTAIVEQSGSVLKTTPEMIKMLAADIVKAELINNQILTEDELTASFNAAYKSAGRAMGHVANNIVSERMQASSNKRQQELQKALEQGDYKRAANLEYRNLLVNKIAYKFMGGASNWVVLNLEKTGLRLLIAPYERSLVKKPTGLSDMKPKDMEEALYRNQVEADKFARGAVGATINAVLFLSAYALIGGDSDENKKRRRALFQKLDKNKWGHKFMNILPMWITSYLAVQEQLRTKEGMAGTVNLFKYSPLRNYLYSSFLNRNDAYSLDNQLPKSIAGITNDSDKVLSRNDKQRKGWETMGKILGNYFNVDPMPYRPFKDVVDITQGVLGEKTKYDRDRKEDGQETGDKPVWYKNMVEGYAKYGLFDW